MILSFLLLSEVDDDYVFLTGNKHSLKITLNHNVYEKVLSQIVNLKEGLHVVILSNLFCIKNA